MGPLKNFFLVHVLFCGTVDSYEQIIIDVHLFSLEVLLLLSSECSL